MFCHYKCYFSFLTSQRCDPPSYKKNRQVHFYCFRFRFAETSEFLAQSTYIKSTTVCMSPRRNWDCPNPSALSRQRVCPSPQNRWGGTHACGWGVGESQFRRREKKLSTLPTLWFLLLFIKPMTPHISRGQRLQRFFLTFLVYIICVLCGIEGQYTKTISH
jgi:hypothetical protein